MVRLVEEHESVGRDIIRRAGHRVYHRQVSVRVRYQYALAEPFRVRTHIRREGRSRLAAAALGVVQREFFYLPAQRRYAALGKRWQRFRRREYHALVHVLRAALARYLEVRHRVDIIAPELYTHGLGIVRREEIEDAAAPRVLAGAFDLLSARIAAAYERRLHLVGRVRAAVLYFKCGLKQRRRRQRPLHKARDGRSAHAALALGELIERRYPPLLRLTRRGLGGVEYKLAHQERVGLYAEHRMQVAREALGSRIVLT